MDERFFNEKCVQKREGTERGREGLKFTFFFDNAESVSKKYIFF